MHRAQFDVHFVFDLLIIVYVHERISEFSLYRIRVTYISPQRAWYR